MEEELAEEEPEDDIRNTETGDFWLSLNMTMQHLGDEIRIPDMKPEGGM